MILRVLTGICGIVVIVLSFVIKNDKDGKYSKSLRTKYTNSSVNDYLRNAFVSELLFGIGMMIQAIFGEGIGFWIGWIMCLTGLILLFIFMRKLELKDNSFKNIKRR